MWIILAENLAWKMGLTLAEGLRWGFGHALVEKLLFFLNEAFCKLIPPVDPITSYACFLDEFVSLLGMDG